MDHGPSWTLDRLHTDDRPCLLRVQSPETPSFSHSRHSPHLDFWMLCFPTDGSRYLAGILSSELMTFMLSFFPNWSYFDFWYSWTKMDERNRSFQWHNMAMENQTLEVVFAETPYPTCRMTIPSVFLVAFVCVMLWKQSSETHWNTWNLEDFEHLLWFTKKNDGCSKIIPFLHSPKKHAAQTAKHVSR